MRVEWRSILGLKSYYQLKRWIKGLQKVHHCYNPSHPTPCLGKAHPCTLQYDLGKAPWTAILHYTYL